MAMFHNNAVRWVTSFKLVESASSESAMDDNKHLEALDESGYV